MDEERAETHLRMVAEAELRRAAGLTGAGAGNGASVRGKPRTERVRRVADALITAGALDGRRADDVLTGLDLALAVRQQDRGAVAVTHTPALRRRLARLVKYGATGVTYWGIVAADEPAAAEAQADPALVVPVGMMLPLLRNDVRGELYLLAYARTTAGAFFTMYARLRGGVGFDPLHRLSAIDDRGATYTLFFTGGGHGLLRSGLLQLDPDPPPGIRWLDLLAHTGPARRISLEPPRPPAVMMTESSHTPGEYLLHVAAAGILAAWPGQPGLPPPPGPPDLGDVIEALFAAGALSPLSPLPGQLVTLCESLGLRDHGIAAPAARNLPAPWQGLLTHAIRRKRDSSPPRSGCAAAAVTLPRLDGMTLSLLGVHSDEDGTMLHVHADGVRLDDDPAAFFPVLWLRDDAGRWHTARNTGWSVRQDGESTAVLPVTPPLNPGTSLEIVAAGRTAEVRASVPLQWR